MYKRQEVGKIASIKCKVIKHSPSFRRNIPYKVLCEDDTDKINLVWFNSRRDYLEKLLPVNKEVIISGKVDIYKNIKQITHPDYIVDDSRNDNIPKIEAKYPLTQGLTNKIVRNNIKNIITKLPKFNEWHDNNFVKEKNWPDFNKAIYKVHNPTCEKDLTSENTSKERIIFDELLAHQILSLIHI